MSVKIGKNKYCVAIWKIGVYNKLHKLSHAEDAKLAEIFDYQPSVYSALSA